MTALNPLRPEQRRAAEPGTHAWVSASAGTGKTQVLTARVLRLLLSGAVPDKILCLTFTKAAAAEMQTRIYQVLARWVRVEDAGLDSDLAALGELGIDGETRSRARRLFARTLESRGGLRIQTLHAFAQSLLASFPLEAGVSPGFTALDDRSGVELRMRALSEALEEARANCEEGFAADVAELAIRHGEQGLAKLVGVLIAHRAGFAGLAGAAAIEPHLRRRLGLPIGASTEDAMAALLADGAFDCESLRVFQQACIAWGTDTGISHADVITTWLGLDPAGRWRHFAGLRLVFATKDGSPRKLSTRMQQHQSVAERLHAACEAAAEVGARFAVAALAAQHLRVGHRLAARYAEHKARAGALDFDDMIERAAAMLSRPGMADWVRYKLDQSIDHILVDEGQDTNLRQWQIVAALTDEIFAGKGVRGDPDDPLKRTLFAVGDFKQAIFGFQGSDPKVFDDYRDIFSERAADSGWPIADVPLAESFRSTDAILDLVNQVLGERPPEALGLREPAPLHSPAARLAGLAGRVVLWPAVADPSQGGDDADEPTEEGWIAESETRMAQTLARQIGQWMRDPPLLATKGRPMRPEDILVLVRKRRGFVAALVAALHRERVPVAGVDRLRLVKPIAVQDLLALIRFVLQPEDSLTLAAILTSPLIGWSQDTLFDTAFERGGQSLWQALRGRERDDPEAARAAGWLREALRIADQKPPYEFLETILSGELQGRVRLLARLGEEARDGIDAVLAQALQFEADHAPSLQGFLAWVESDDVELKRDPDAPVDAVRIMTVHGAKGLQAPVVILADAARTARGRADAHVLMDWGIEDAPLPVFYGGKEGRVAPIAERLDGNARTDAEEELRLLYVALTRAEEMLFVGGSLGKREAVPSDESWHAIVRRSLAALCANAEPSELWRGDVLTYARGERIAEAPALPYDTADAVAIPDWARTAPPPEAVPPRPLSPSQIAADDVAQPPPSAAMADAARRGQLLHALFERLPEAAAERRDPVARAWLARQAPELDDAERAALADQVLAIIADPRFEALFSAQALAEAPVAALVGRTVIAGTVDRLLVEDDRVRIVDFKTGSRIPNDTAEAEVYHLKQMAAYVTALERVFPGRRVEAALLYTAAPKLLLLPPEVIDAHRPVEPDDSPS